MESASNDAGTYTYTYDGDNRIASVTEPTGVTLSFGYDDQGNRISVADSLGGVEDSTYDAAGDLLSRTLTDCAGNVELIDFVYDEDGNMTEELRYADAAGTELAGSALVGTTNEAYDAAGNVTSIVDKDAAGTVLLTYDYTYNTAGQLASETDNGTTIDYQYDGAGQLIAAGSSTYNYDANGNRNGSGDVIGPDNELLSDGTWDYTYDAQGNMTGKTDSAGETWTYGYDNANQMTSAVDTNGAGDLDLGLGVQV